MKGVILLAATWWLSTAAAFAQGIQTGTIRGMVKDQQDLPIQGVTVTARSPVLQPPRSTVGIPPTPPPAP